MMKNIKEKLELALEAAYLAGFNASGEGYNGEYPFSDIVYKPQDDADWVQNRDAALREALASEAIEQPAEPVTWGVDWGKAGDIPCVSIIKRLLGGGIEVVAVEYGTQRTWVGLTDEEIYSVLENLQVMYNRPPTTDSRIIFAEAIEAKLKAKNSL
jgi:hypothetical protein